MYKLDNKLDFMQLICIIKDGIINYNFQIIGNLIC